MSQTRSNNFVFDLLIIGGGINGVGIANDAAGRGLSVALCEQDDLASGTSWKSSKLIHGGLRYLQYYDFHLVRKALIEREILLKKAPHIIRPLQFILPHDKNMSPAWMIRIGLFIYDHLAKRQLLPSSHGINLTNNNVGIPLKKNLTQGFSYYDCYVDDARLVILNAVQAKQLGAEIYPRTKVISAKRGKDYWEVEAQNILTQQVSQLKTRVLVNATGPWIEKTLHMLNIESVNKAILVKGSHIVIPKFYPGDHAYILENIDKRVIFVIPFENDYCMIGTTDMPFTNDPRNVTISDDEITYLCAVINRYFQHTINPTEIIWSFAGVRPLHEEVTTKNLSAISRDYLLEINTDDNKAPVLNIFGGKITTYRELSEHALKLLKPYFPKMTGPWTQDAALPGGDMPKANFQEFFQKFRQQYPWLDADLAQRYAHNYGTLIDTILDNANSMIDLGKHYGAGLYQREIEYLNKYEWAQTAEDILWRRTKLGLTFPDSAIKELDADLIKLIGCQPSLA